MSAPPPGVTAWLPLSATEAPAAWPLPWRRVPDLPGTWRDRLDGLPPGDVHVGGGEPLRLPDLGDLLDALTARGRRVVLHTDLPDVHEDVVVRLFAPYDVRFRVNVPTADPARLHGWTDGAGDLEQVEAGLRNLQAFAYTTWMAVPVARETLTDVVPTLQHLLHTYAAHRIHLDVVHGTAPDDPRWAHAPAWDDVDAALLGWDRTEPRPHPRLVVHGMPGLGLSLDAYTDLDLEVEGAPDDPWQVPEGLVRHRGAASPDTDALARRRIWLATPPAQRANRRGHPLARFVDAVSVVLVRPGHEVYAVIVPRTDGLPFIATTDRHGLLVAGRFEDATLRERFGTLARQVYARARTPDPQDAPLDLARLRALAHVLRRGMRERHDDEPVAWREEGG
ncbi:MAG: radical SAM protein [Alphaproteobacteria bacterium]|nr:radical SAM protein [Alphaproteobacteria bacterium]